MARLVTPDVPDRPMAVSIGHYMAHQSLQIIFSPIIEWRDGICPICDRQVEPLSEKNVMLHYTVDYVNVFWSSHRECEGINDDNRETWGIEVEKWIRKLTVGELLDRDVRDICFGALAQAIIEDSDLPEKMKRSDAPIQA